MIMTYYLIIMTWIHFICLEMKRLLMYTTKLSHKNNISSIKKLFLEGREVWVKKVNMNFYWSTFKKGNIRIAEHSYIAQDYFSVLRCVSYPCHGLHLCIPTISQMMTFELCTVNKQGGPLSLHSRGHTINHFQKEYWFWFVRTQDSFPLCFSPS